MIQGLLDLFEADADPRWLEAALALQAQLDAHHRAPGGGYHTTADDGEALLTRDRPSYDGAEPSGNAVAALNLLRLHELSPRARGLDRGGNSEELRFEARRLLEAFSGELRRNPRSAPKLLCALDFIHDRPLQIFVVTPAGEPIPAELLAVIRRSFVPNRALAIVAEDEIPRLQGLIPALEHSAPAAGRRRPTCARRGCARRRRATRRCSPSSSRASSPMASDPVRPQP